MIRILENLNYITESTSFNINVPFIIDYIETTAKGTHIFHVKLGTNIIFKLSVYVNDKLDIIEVRYCNLNNNIANDGITLEKSYYSIYKYNSAKKHRLISSCLQGIILKELSKI
jgi:hypothetical protein